MSQTVWFSRLRRLARDDSGPTSVEYAILLALIVVVCVGAVKNMANATGSSFDRSATAISEALGG